MDEKELADRIKRYKQEKCHKFYTDEGPDLIDGLLRMDFTIETYRMVTAEEMLDLFLNDPSARESHAKRPTYDHVISLEKLVREKQSLGL